jgi:hypothetical protein
VGLSYGPQVHLTSHALLVVGLRVRMLCRIWHMNLTASGRWKMLQRNLNTVRTFDLLWKDRETNTSVVRTDKINKIVYFKLLAFLIITNVSLFY